MVQAMVHLCPSGGPPFTQSETLSTSPECSHLRSWYQQMGAPLATHGGLNQIQVISYFWVCNRLLELSHTGFPLSH